MTIKFYDTLMASWQKRWEEDKATKKQRRSARRGREQSREFSIGA